MRSHRGLTLLEMMVSLTLIGLIFAAVIAIYVVGSKAWRKGNVRGELLQELQVISNKLTKDAERTTLPSVTIGPAQDKISLLRLYDQDGDFLLNSLGRPIWTSWAVYFQDGSDLRYQEVPWPADEATRTNPLQIEALDPPLTLDDYAVGGKSYSSNLLEFQITPVPDAPAMNFKVTLEKAITSQIKETLISEQIVRMRN